MKKQLLIITLLLSLFLLTSLAGFAQTTTSPTTPSYALLEYMKIEPGKTADYRKVEQEIWMPIHKERVKAKLISGWALYGVRYPGGTAREYDVIAVTLYNSFKDLENSYPPEVFTKAHPNMTAAERNAQTGPTRKILRTEVISLVDSAWPGGEDPRAVATAAPAKYVRVDYKKIEAGKASDYVANERKYYKPLWQAAVDAGTMRGWAVWGVRMPGGTDKEYGFVTVQFFDKFEQMEGNPSRGLWDKVHPTTKSADIYTQMGTISRTVRSKVLTLLDQVR